MLNLVNAYLKTRYRVLLPSGWLSVRVGEPIEPGIPDLTSAEWMIITACNPASRPLPAGHNFVRHRLLSGALSTTGWPRHPSMALPGEGQPYWPAEYGWLVLDGSREALLNLASGFSQNAVIHQRPGEPPYLCIMRGPAAAALHCDHPFVEFA